MVAAVMIMVAAVAAVRGCQERLHHARELVATTN
jgi:hypothetical protein